MAQLNLQPYEIQKIWVVSTAHIEQETGEKLANRTLNCPSLEWFNEGEDVISHRIKIPKDPTQLQILVKDLIEAMGTMSYLYRLTIRAFELGCDWLVLDPDGPVRGGELAVFDW